MRKIFFVIHLLFLFGQIPHSFAEDIFFPFPKGAVYITNGYGGSDTHQKHSYHSLDLRTYEDNACNSYGAPILAPQSGIVSKAVNSTNGKGYGTYVDIQNSEGTLSRHAHMIYETLTVTEGDAVKQGQILGLMGATGNTAGMTCSAFDGQNIGAHLHYEMRNADGSAYKPEPLIGEETYTGLSKTDNPYSSTSIMYDPSNHWNLYNGKVPYRLSYNPAQLESIHPLLVNAGTKTNFTITGTSLPDDLVVSIPDCNNLQWLSRTDTEQQFSCEVADLAGQEISNGTITSKTYGAIPFEFILRVLSPEASFPVPKFHQVTADRKRPGELKTFTIRGENLPGDLLFQFPECTDQDFIMRSPDEQRVQCRIPRRVEDSEGKRINDLHTFSFQLSDPRQDLQFEATHQENYRIHISRVTPVEGAYGIPNTFTFIGDNVDLADAFFIERCGELREVSRAQKRVKIQCTPLIRESFLNTFVPSLFNQRLHYFVVKDKPRGEKLIEGNILMQMTDKIYVTGVVPTRPILLEQNEFEMTGAHLPESLLVWVPNCDGLKVYPKEHISESIRFICTPQLQSSTKDDVEALDQKMTRLMGPLAQMPDLSEFEDFFEKQKRIVEIKLPKNVSDIDENEKALVLSRKEISPISVLYSRVLDQLEGYFPDDVGGEPISEDIKSNFSEIQTYKSKETSDYIDLQAYLIPPEVENILAIDNVKTGQKSNEIIKTYITPVQSNPIQYKYITDARPPYFEGLRFWLDGCHFQDNSNTCIFLSEDYYNKTHVWTGGISPGAKKGYLYDLNDGQILHEFTYPYNEERPYVTKITHILHSATQHEVSLDGINLDPKYELKANCKTISFSREKLNYSCDFTEYSEMIGSPEFRFNRIQLRSPNHSVTSFDLPHVYFPEMDSVISKLFFSKADENLFIRIQGNNLPEIKIISEICTDPQLISRTSDIEMIFSCSYPLSNITSKEIFSNNQTFIVSIQSESTFVNVIQSFLIKNEPKETEVEAQPIGYDLQILYEPKVYPLMKVDVDAKPYFNHTYIKQFEIQNNKGFVISYPGSNQDIKTLESSDCSREGFKSGVIKYESINPPFEVQNEASTHYYCFLNGKPINGQKIFQIVGYSNQVLKTFSVELKDGYLEDDLKNQKIVLDKALYERFILKGNSEELKVFDVKYETTQTRNPAVRFSTNYFKNLPPRERISVSIEYCFSGKLSAQIDKERSKIDYTYSCNFPTLSDGLRFPEGEYTGLIFDKFANKSIHELRVEHKPPTNSYVTKIEQVFNGENMDIYLSGENLSAKNQLSIQNCNDSRNSDRVAKLIQSDDQNLHFQCKADRRGNGYVFARLDDETNSPIFQTHALPANFSSVVDVINLVHYIKNHRLIVHLYVSKEVSNPLLFINNLKCGDAEELSSDGLSYEYIFSCERPQNLFHFETIPSFANVRLDQSTYVLFKIENIFSKEPVLGIRDQMNYHF